MLKRLNPGHLKAVSDRVGKGGRQPLRARGSATAAVPYLSSSGYIRYRGAALALPDAKSF